MATGTKWVIGTVAVAFSLAGLLAGAYAWRSAVYRPALEPAVLAHGWYIDEGIAATVSGPLARTASAFSFGVDLGFIDGIVNGVASLTAQTGPPAAPGRRRATSATTPWASASAPSSSCPTSRLRVGG